MRPVPPVQMLRRGALLLMLAFAGCTARTLDELSSSYARLVTQAAETRSVRMQDPPTQRPRQTVDPPPGTLGSAFLVVGRDALTAASEGGTDARTRIALYRIAAASAHFALVEQAATGQPVTVGTTPTAATDSVTQGGASVLLRAAREAAPLCGGLQEARPPRDCTYLGMAASLTNLAIVAEPWLFLPQVRPADPANVAQHAEAFARSPDDLFGPAWTTYQHDSGAMLERLGATQDQAAGGSALLPAGYVRESDVRAFCIVATRAAKVRALGATPMAGADIERNTDMLIDARSWFAARYGGSAPQCAS